MLMRSLIVAALALPALTGGALANETRMTQTEVVRAARCLAFADLAVLQSDRPDTAALAQRVRGELASKPSDIQKQAARETRRVMVYALQADTPQEVTKLKERRDRLCSEFIAAPVLAASN